MGRVRMRSQDTIHPSEVRKRILRAALPAALLVSLMMKPVPAFSGGGSRAEMILIPPGNSEWTAPPKNGNTATG